MAMTETDKKKLKVMDLLFEIDDPIFKQFFDVESDKMLDEKIEVLTALKSGKTVSEIPNYYGVLELYHNGMWD